MFVAVSVSILTIVFITVVIGTLLMIGGIGILRAGRRRSTGISLLLAGTLIGLPSATWLLVFLGSGVIYIIKAGTVS